LFDNTKVFQLVAIGNTGVPLNTHWFVLCCFCRFIFKKLEIYLYATKGSKRQV